MSDYQFHPCRDDICVGLLETKEGTYAAEFLTPERAARNARHLGQYRDEELRLLRQMKRELRYASELA